MFARFNFFPSIMGSLKKLDITFSSEMSNMKKLFLFAAGLRSPVHYEDVYNDSLSQLKSGVTPIQRPTNAPKVIDEQIKSILNIYHFMLRYRAIQCANPTRDLIAKIDILRDALINEKNNGLISSERAYEVACATYAYAVCVAKSSNQNERGEAEDLYLNMVNPLLQTNPLLRGAVYGVIAAAVAFSIALAVIHAPITLPSTLFFSAISSTALALKLAVPTAMCTLLGGAFGIFTAKKKIDETMLKDIVTHGNLFKRVNT